MVAIVSRDIWEQGTVAGVGDLIRQRRLLMGLTQEQLEELSGVSQNSISQLESGTTTQPKAETIRRLAGPLDLSITDFYMAMSGGEAVTVGEEVAVPDFGCVPAVAAQWAAMQDRGETVDVPRCWVSSARSPLFVVHASDGILTHGILAGDVVVLATYVADSPIPDGTVVLVRVDGTHTLDVYQAGNDVDILGTFYALLRQPVAEG